MPEIDRQSEVLEVVPSPTRSMRAGVGEGVDRGQQDGSARTHRHDTRSVRGEYEELGWVQWCLDHQPLVGGVIVGGVLTVATALTVIDDSSSSTSVSRPAPSAYQQGYSYGQRLDNQGYGSGEAYAECRGSRSQQQDDILVFQMACDIGYAQ